MKKPVAIAAVIFGSGVLGLLLAIFTVGGSSSSATTDGPVAGISDADLARMGMTFGSPNGAPNISEEQARAVAHDVHGISRVIGTRLVMLTSVRYTNKLVWLISADPRDSQLPFGCGGAIPGSDTKICPSFVVNYQLEVIDAITGEWLQTMAGASDIAPTPTADATTAPTQLETPVAKGEATSPLQ